MLATLTRLVKDTLRRRDGVTALEYAVIAGVAATVLVAAFTAFYTDLQTALQAVL
ncbi:Flp family type IVb pilin [Falsiroseomonas sp.]|uniref:Flp family type IVb pilin n=1 Tax=Falsiroseomonas sp. TaxID=2870721 RepID=UPI0035688E3A